MGYFRKLAGGLVLMNSEPWHGEQLEQLQMVCFPTLADEERFKAVHSARQPRCV